MADTKEKPIPFSGEMVRAILEGRKTQTRRIFKQAEKYGLSYAVDCGDGVWGDEEGNFQCKCPYGQPGDRLWVREAWRTESNIHDHLKPSQMAWRGGYLYEADANYGDNKTAGRYRHARFMPRTASRILLEITDVRVERLQDISEEDAIAEGVRGEPCDHKRQSCEDIGCYGDSAKGAYRGLWESLNGPGSWEENPWVWVIEFKVAEAKG